MKHSTEYSRETLNDILRQIAEKVILRPFREDYQAFVSRDLNYDHKDFYANLSAAKIYILRNGFLLPGHGSAEYIVLQDRNSDAHVVLRGEVIKRNLDYLGGVCGFLTTGKDPVEEIAALVENWKKSIISVRRMRDYGRRDRVQQLFTQMGRPEFDKAFDMFIAPVLRPGAMIPANAPEAPKAP